MSQYTRNPPLTRAELDADPMRQLERWIADARDAGMIEPTAMTLATATPEGRPAARIVLFKGLDDGQPTFFTNMASRKGRALADNPFAALVFWWDRLERQVRVEGRVTPLPRATNEAYFAKRPRVSQVAAAVSAQSERIASRDDLDARMAEAEARFGDEPVPCPEHGGGYRLAPDLVEFWQGRLGRAHDRLQYEAAAGGGWEIVRLQP